MSNSTEKEEVKDLNQPSETEREEQMEGAAEIEEGKDQPETSNNIEEEIEVTEELPAEQSEEDLVSAETTELTEIEEAVEQDEVSETVAEEKTEAEPEETEAEPEEKTTDDPVTAAPEEPVNQEDVKSEEEEILVEKKSSPNTFETAEESKPEDFDWEELEKKGFGEGYTDKEKKELSKLYEGTLNTITEKEVINGTVVDINDKDVVVNIGFKSDGLVASSEFRDMPDLKIGDEVEVYVEEQEDAIGQLVLSRRKAKIVKAWENIQSAYDDDDVIEGFVKRRTKGGLIVDIYGIEAFLPGSQIDVKPIRDFDVFVEKKMEVKVVKINYANDNVVVSHKVLIEKDLEAQKAVILNNLEKGQVLEGVIKNMTNFGVFIDLGGVDGLLHITDVSWGRINHPEEVLNLDETVKVVVLDFDEDKKRISLGMKQLTAHPWDSLPEDIEVGSKVKGKIVNVADYGAFLELMPGVEGLIHVSEMSWSQHLRNPQDFMEVGDEIEAVVLTIDREERKMSLGIKQLTEDPWTKHDVLTKYAVNTTHTGVVRNLTNFGLFIELEEGIDGLVHVSDLSWTRKIKHPSEFVKVGDELEVKVLELDVDNRRLALGHKQLEENPWEAFEDTFAAGTVHKCTVVSITDKGATLELPYGIEGFSSRKNLVKEDGAKAQEGEILDFVVLDFSKDDKKIVLSHSHTYRDEAEKPKAKSKKKPKKSTLDKINQETEVSTLGDLEALSELKTKMEGDVVEEKSDKKKETKKSTSKKEEPKDKADTVSEEPDTLQSEKRDSGEKNDAAEEIKDSTEEVKDSTEEVKDSTEEVKDSTEEVKDSTKEKQKATKKKKADQEPESKPEEGGDKEEKSAK